jgi:hypothetical protein
MNLDGFDLEDNEIRTFEKSLISLEKHFQVEIIDYDNTESFSDLIDNIKLFQILSHYKDFEVINIFNLNPDTENIKIANLSLTYTFVGSKGQIHELSEIQNIGYLELPVDFGYCLITPETKADKVLDFFLRREVKFHENKEFNDKFYVLGSNKEIIRRKISNGIQLQLQKYPNINIEIQGNKLLATFQKRMTIKETDAIAKVLKKIKNEINEA